MLAPGCEWYAPCVPRGFPHCLAGAAGFELYAAGFELYAPRKRWCVQLEARCAQPGTLSVCQSVGKPLGNSWCAQLVTRCVPLETSAFRSAPWASSCAQRASSCTQHVFPRIFPALWQTLRVSSCTQRVSSCICLLHLIIPHVTLGLSLCAPLSLPPGPFGPSPGTFGAPSGSRDPSSWATWDPTRNPTFRTLQEGPGNTTHLHVHADTAESVGNVGACMALAAEVPHLTTQALE
jgi:hypothetical protein